MWFKVLKPFGLLLEGELIELKEDAQHQSLVEKGLLEETEAPQIEVIKPVANDVYSTTGIVTEIKEPAKVKNGPKKKENK